MNAHIPPTVIAFATSKGGSGKSTTCLAIAGALAFKGMDVTIIDFDQTETLYRWYQNSPKAIPNLRVEKGPGTIDGEFLTNIWNKRSGCVLFDLAGAMTNQMIALTAFAAITISPAKISEPDITEAMKVHQNMLEMQRRVNKPVLHKILLNDVPARVFAGYQNALLDQINTSGITRFDTILKNRAAYPEAFLTYQPPHYADQTRAAVAKAVEEVDYLVDEIFAAINQEEQKVAA